MTQLAWPDEREVSIVGEIGARSMRHPGWTARECGSDRGDRIDADRHRADLAADLAD